MKDALFAVALAAAFGLVTAGAHTFSHGAGLIVGGVLLAVYAAIVLGEVGS